MALVVLDGPIVLVGDAPSDRPANPPHLALFYNKGADQLSFWNGSTWNTRESFVFKAADETVNNSAALQNDNDLVLSVVADTKYLLESQIIYDSGTTPDIKFAWVGPAAATLDWTTNALGTGATGVNGALTVGNSVIGDAGVLAAGGVGAGTAVTAMARGILQVGATAGTLQLRWAQNTADVSDTIVKVRSWMRLTKVG